MSPQPNAFIKWSALAIMVVAGAWTLFHLIWSVLRSNYFARVAACDQTKVHLLPGVSLGNRWTLALASSSWF